MTTRTGSRIYRGTTAMLPPGACPHCGRRDVTVTSTGRRREHTDPATGDRCSASGIHIGEQTVDLGELPEIVISRSPIVEAPLRCPECGISPPGRPRADGRLRRHRTRVDDPTAPWCVASPTDRTD